MGFDMRFLYIRAAILNIPVPAGCFKLSQLIRKYTHIPHTDLERYLSNWEPHRISLDNAANIFLGKKKIEHDFTKFISLIETGKSDEIGVYNLCDAELTYNLFKKLKQYLF